MIEQIERTVRVCNTVDKETVDHLVDCLQDFEMDEMDYKLAVRRENRLVDVVDFMRLSN